MGFGLGGLVSAGAGLLGGAMNARAASQASEQFEKVAKINAEAAARENAIQREFALKLLDMSRPQMSADELGDLLFSQGQQTYNENQNRMLQATLRNNLRQGMPVSNADIMSRFADEGARSMADRRADATLKGITGTLPGAAAIQSAASLYQPAAIPQMQAAPPNYTTGNTIMALGGTLTNLLNQYQMPRTYTQLGNQGGTA